jgi:hypothetical protein
MEDIECVFESVSGSGSIFISNHPAAQNLYLLQSKGLHIQAKEFQPSCPLPEVA